MVFGIKVKENLRNKEFWRAAFAELFGTFLLVFLSIGAVVITVRPEPLDTSNTTTTAVAEPESLSLAAAEQNFSVIARIALCTGAVIGGVLFSLAHVSNHVNPTFSLAFFILGKTSLVRMIIFFVIQCIGALVAAACLYAIVPSTRDNFFMCTMMNPALRPIEGFACEVAVTTVLVFGIITIYTKLDPHGKNPGIPSIGITFLATVLLCIGIPLSGCSMNPARSLGPALILHGKCWENHWIYWLGPLTGGLLGALILRVSFGGQESEEEASAKKHECPKEVGTDDEKKVLETA